MASNMLKVLVTGNVDNGKSTILGRLFYESELIYDDQLNSIYRNGNLDFSLFTDGLYQEIQEGITYDIAHLFYQKSGKRIIFLDSPGHKKFAHNMIAACSHADLALILLDILEPLSPRTIDQINCAAFFNIKNYIFCINKMDLVGYSHEKYLAKVEEIKQHFSQSSLKNVSFLGVSALEGEAITKPSIQMPWQEKTSLMEMINRANDSALGPQDHSHDAVFSVQHAWYDSNKNVTFIHVYTNAGHFDPSQTYYIPSLDKWFTLQNHSTSHPRNHVVSDISFLTTFSFMLPGKEELQRGDVLLPASLLIEPIKCMKVALLNLYDFDEIVEPHYHVRLGTQEAKATAKYIKRVNNHYIAELEFNNPIYLVSAHIEHPSNRLILLSPSQDQILFVGKPLSSEHTKPIGEMS